MTDEYEPAGNHFSHLFDANGRTSEVSDQEGGSRKYSRTVAADGDVRVEVRTAEGNVLSYLNQIGADGNTSAIVTDPTGAQSVTEETGSGMNVTQSLPCGMEHELTYELDPRYRYKDLTAGSEKTPAGLTRTFARTRTYEDTDADGASERITEQTSVNDKVVILVRDLPAGQWTMTSPEGRTMLGTYDALTLLPSTVAVPGLNTTFYSYDPRGRLTATRIGTRTTGLSYNNRGLLETVTDPENRTVFYTYDANGRVTSIERPDSSLVDFAYDANGNMTMLTTPASIEHGFGYTHDNDFKVTDLTYAGNAVAFTYDHDGLLTGTGRFAITRNA